MTDSRLVKYAE